MVSIFITILFLSSASSISEEIATEVEIKTSSWTNNNKRLISDDSNAEDRETYFPSRKRFSATSASSHFKWSFSDERKCYAFEQFHTYIKDTNLDDSILTNNSVPQIFAGPDPLDDYLKSQLNKIKKNEIQQDKSCQKVQQKMVNVMVSLT